MAHMFNVECCKLHDRWSLKFLRGMLLNGDAGGFVLFWIGLQEKGAHDLGGISWGGDYDLHMNYGMVVILLSFLFNYDNLTLKLHQEKRSNPV